MNDLEHIQEKYIAGDKIVGFDYQFYYFTYLALGLKFGEKIGFEVKDDIHIEMPNGTIILYQAKHTVLIKRDGSPENLSTLDIDLWKTLSNWCDIIKSNNSILENYEFRLVTNKIEGNNEFIESLLIFKDDHCVDKVISLLKNLRDKTKNKELKEYFNNILSIRKKSMRSFLLSLNIECGTDDIINKIKNRIYENCHQENLVDSIFDLLVSNLSIAKYLDIKDRKKFEITFDDFNTRFGRCFKDAYKKKPLPKRNFAISLPENLEEQIFIRQLLDIEDISPGCSLIIEYTEQMLKTMNNLKYWTENNYILPTEFKEFRNEAIGKWKNEFRSKYRKIEKKIRLGCSIIDYDNEIKELAIELVDYLRKINLTCIDVDLDTELSNGYYYMLSNTLDIGWHYDWEQKYKTK